MTDRPPGGDAAPADPSTDAPPQGFLEAAHGAWDDLRELLAERGRLLTLELRLTGLALLQLLVLAVGVALLGVTAWLGVVAAIVVGLAALGLGWAWAILLGVVLNALLAYLLVRAIVRRSADIGVPASLRQMQAHASD